MVRLVQHRHQQVSCRRVAAHEAVGVAGLDHLDGELYHVGAVVHRLKVIVAVLEPEALQHLLDPLVIPDQDRLDKSVGFGLEQAFQDRLRIGACQCDAHALSLGAGFGDDGLIFFWEFDAHGGLPPE